MPMKPRVIWEPSTLEWIHGIDVEAEYNAWLDEWFSVGEYDNEDGNATKTSVESRGRCHGPR